MKQVRVVLTCDEGFVEQTLREFAIMAINFKFDEYYFEHGTGIIEPYKEEEE